MPEVIDFDPNHNYCGNTCKKTVRLTFGQWKYRLVVDQVVGGNGSGLSNIECAIGAYLDTLVDEHENLLDVVLTNEEGDTLSCDVEDESDLAKMLIAAEIIAIEPEGNTLWKKV